MAQEPKIAYKPKLDKLLEAILYIVEKAPGRDQYQMVKVLYLADVEHLNRFGRPITFDSYVAMDYGPVGSNALNILKEHYGTMMNMGIEKLPFRINKRDESRICTYDNPDRRPDLRKFSKSDIEVLDEAIKEYGHRDFDFLYDITHKHAAYNNAWDKRGGMYAFPMDFGDMLSDDIRTKEIIEDLAAVSRRI